MQDFNDKINNVYQDIISETKKRLDLLLSLCESPIEKLFFINIFNHYNKLSLTHVKIEFISRGPTMHEESTGTILPGLYVDDITEFSVVLQGLRIRGIQETNIMPLNEFVLSHQKKKPGDTTTFYTFNIYPQYKLLLDERLFRMDFAIIIEKELKNTISKEIFCVECDGHDFHKSKEQRAYDNERMRIFLKNGIKTLRYTGSEITNFDRDKVIDFDNTLMKNISRKDSFIFILRYF